MGGPLTSSGVAQHPQPPSRKPNWQWDVSDGQGVCPLWVQ